MADQSMAERPPSGDAAPDGVLLKLENLSKTFPGTKALVNVDLDIRAGEVHALLGHNGSGKSTLIKVLSGYHSPDAGASVSLNGEPVNFWSSPTASTGRRRK